MNDHISGEDLAAYVDGLLSAAKKSELESHFSRCPACLDELAEIAAIMRSRDKVLAGGQGKIPAEFIKLALGEKSKAAKPVLHLRLVFEIAAAFMVVVFIGYLFLSGNRFWQIPEQQKPPLVTDKNVRHAEPAVSCRDREIAPMPVQRRGQADARKSKSARAEAAAGQGLTDSFDSEKRGNAFADKGLPAAGGKSVPASEQDYKLKEIAGEQPAAEKENLQKKELARSAMAPQSVGAVQMDFAAKDQTAAKVMEKKATEAKQNLERQKEPGSAAALPIEAQAKAEKLQDEGSSLKSSVSVQVTSGAAQPAYAGKKQHAALARKAIAAKKTISPIHIEGDVVWTDLRNPELLSAWSWWQKGLALELQIDKTGAVIAVVPLGKFDQPLARQAENEAKKLLFSVSEKKSRRGRLIANESPPN
jgi:hypothetical protein